MDSDGGIIAESQVPVIKAPIDLIPKTIDVVLNIPEGKSTKGLRIQIDPKGQLSEITKSNNSIRLNADL